MLRRFNAFICIRRGTYITWYNLNPVLMNGEISYITSGTDRGKFKIGDGVTPWRQLEFSAARYPEDILNLINEPASDDIPYTGDTISILQKIINFLKGMLNRFNPNSGHKHNGVDSPNISYNDLLDTYIITNYVDNADNILRNFINNEIFNVNTRISNIENLGHLAGIFETVHDLPTDTSEFSNGITLNDFAKIVSDENYNNASTLYTVIDITDNNITWKHSLTYNTDITGKMDVVANAIENNIMIFNNNGNAKDSGININNINLTGNINQGSGDDVSTPSLNNINIWDAVQIIWDRIHALSNNEIDNKFSFIATGSNTIIAYSKDGLAWEFENSSIRLGSIAKGNNLFVAVVANNGGVATSIDGVNWNIVSSNTYTHIKYMNNLFYAISDNAIATSADGVNWNSISVINSLRYDITFGNNTFVAVGRYIIYSTNGVNWTTVNNNNLQLNSIAFGNGIFVGAGNSVIRTSTNGVNWDSVANSYYFNRITFANNLFVAVGSGVIATSTDGLNWNFNNVTGNFGGVTYGNGLFVAVSTTTIATSANGVNWDVQSITGYPLSFVLFIE